MNLTDEHILKFQRGSPIFIDDICAVFPVFMGEIIDLGYENFQKCLGTITLTKPPLKKGDTSEFAQLLNQLTDFQYLLLLANSEKEVNENLRMAFDLFCREKEIIFSLNPAQIILGPIEEQHLLSEEKFHDLQRIISRMCFLEQEGEEIIINEDDNDMVKNLKMQMRANREKLRKAKANNKSSDLKFSDLIGSITINNCGLNMENIWNITYYAFHDQLKRMGWRDQFNINNQAVLAGAKIDKSQLKHWMRSINSTDTHN